MFFPLRHILTLLCFILIIGCVPSGHDIKKSYNQASKNLSQTMHSMEDKILKKLTQAQTAINLRGNQYKPEKSENIVTLLSTLKDDTQKDIYDEGASFQNILANVISLHPEVQAAQYLEQAAEQEVVASAGLNKPQITGSLNTGGVNKNISSSTITPGIGLSAGISQVIYDGGYTAAGIGQKAALFEKAKANNALVKNKIGFNAASAWIDLWTLNEKLKEINSTIQNANPILADIKRMAESGLIDRTIVDNIENNLLNISINKHKLETDIELAELYFENFYGKVPHIIVKPKSPFELKIFETKMEDKSLIPSLRLAAAELIASREEVKAIRGELKPKVKFNLAANSPLDRDDNATLAVGIMSTYVFSDGGTLKARLKVAQARSSKMSFVLKSAKIETMKSIKSDIMSLNFLEQSRSLNEESLDRNTQSLSILKAQILTGQSKLNNLIDMHIERIGIINNLLDNTAQNEKIKYSLASILGIFSGLKESK